MKQQIEYIIKKWLENESKSAYVDYIDFAEVTMDGSFDIEELSSLIADEVLKVVMEKIEELELSCVDDSLLGRTDEYLIGYNTSTTRWRIKRDELLSTLSPNNENKNN